MPAALAVTVGGAIVAVAGALHPPTFDPGNAGAALAAIERAPSTWLLVHLGMGVGLVIWTAGIVAAASATSGDENALPMRSLTWLAIGTQLVALPLWLSALAVEAVGLPMAVDGLAAVVTRAPAAAVLWAPILLAGYAGTALQWAGLWLLALILSGSNRRNLRLTGRIGLVVLPLGLPTLTILWFFPNLVRILGAVVLGPGLVWSIFTAFQLRRRHR